MEHAALVTRLQGQCRLPSVIAGQRRRERAHFIDERIEASPIHVLVHHEWRGPV